MAKRKQMPVAVTIAGSDSGGGAGIQADLQTFSSLGVHGTSAITCLTAQNPAEVKGIQATRPEVLRRQLEAVFEMKPVAAKTGMLYSAALIRVVADFFAHRPLPLVVDPVMVSTSGMRLLQAPALKVLQQELFPRATVITPNVPEAELLTGGRLETEEDLRAAARQLHGAYRCAVLLKGGHLPRRREAVDIFYDGRNELMLSAAFVRGVSTHGTGCTYAAAIAGYLALGCELPSAVELAKEYITQAIAQSCQAGGHSVLNWFWR